MAWYVYCHRRGWAPTANTQTHSVTINRHTNAAFTSFIHQQFRRFSTYFLHFYILMAQFLPSTSTVLYWTRRLLMCVPCPCSSSGLNATLNFFVNNNNNNNNRKKRTQLSTRRVLRYRKPPTTPCHFSVVFVRWQHHIRLGGAFPYIWQW